MEVIPVIGLVTLVYAFVNFIKQAKAGNVSATVTQILVWAAAIGAVFLFAQSSYADSVDVGHDQVLSALDGWSLLIVGLGLGSTASAGYDVKRAIDNNDSAAQPKLLDE